ncbi:hypothetical protein SAMN05421743_10255 [Thalassobacillus cyri]|uniref:Uncharacterized protein n=1 Tax=Thalassobacillus cyri TaxID=571932 RepID=A0A1H3X615_9BACI|nr:hypothetical protein [Thalassobacillus cyri]SDZ94857.1 hypothetical protein SAMN05421743_10255 [Thalassobacillus cyri]
MLEEQLRGMEEYNTAILNEQMLREVQDLEQKLKAYTNEPVILIAYTHR